MSPADALRAWQRALVAHERAPRGSAERVAALAALDERERAWAAARVQLSDEQRAAMCGRMGGGQ